MVHNPFVNEAFTDFSCPENKAKQEQALAAVAAQCGQQIPLVIDGERILTEAKEASVDPSELSRVVGYQSMATPEHTERALSVATERFKTWQYSSAEMRSKILLKAAAIMRRRRFELNAWMIYEVGKSWLEADADTAESIDFLEFYAREMLRLDGPQPLYPCAGEDNELRYIPLGPCSVIPPWNFPNAILVGMTTAAVVAGNTVLLKPAEQSPIIGFKCFEILEEAGLPAGVVNFLTGVPEQVGETMVVDRRVRLVAFTGSKAVGLGISAKAGQVVEGQRWIKRAVLEMGGKDSVVVDESADFDAAVKGVVAGAFGFQGQKCSAGSRAIIHEAIYDRFVQAVKTQTQTLVKGHPANPLNTIAAVIDEDAFKRISSYIDIGKSEGTLVCGGGANSEAGYFIEPTVFSDIGPNDRLAQEEIFGPVLALIKAKDFDEALDIANNTEYGLTGAVFSNKREHLERARREFHVGNLYLNRKCTGALVGVHPFGGFNMSGTDSKAGGRDYLLLFTQAKSITERL